MNKFMITTAVLVLFSTSVSAKCYLKEVTASHTEGSIMSIKNVERTLFPWKNGRKCVVEFDALVEGNWNTGYGDSIFKSDETEDAGCTRALKNGKVDLLQELFPQEVQSDHVMVCGDQDKAKRNTGEGLQANPKKPNAFDYKGRWCRWFFHTVREGTDLYQWNIIACVIPNQKDEVSWEVIDNF